MADDIEKIVATPALPLEPAIIDYVDIHPQDLEAPLDDDTFEDTENADIVDVADVPEEQNASVCAHCGENATLKCTGCKNTFYCSKEHQKTHWKDHKLACRPFDVRHSEELGRHLVATRDLEAGDLILSEYPIVFGPRPHMVEEGPVPCPGCCRLILAESSPRCSGCSWPVCHPACAGLSDPHKHALECLLLELRMEIVNEHFHTFFRQDTLLALRCLLLQKKNAKKWEQLMEMEAHMEKRGEDTQVYKDIEERVVHYLNDNYINPLREMEKKSNQSLIPDVSAATIHKVCAIIDVNSLEINQDAEISALYATACLMEHSCISNTVHVFANESANYKITVRAAVPIKKGEHISMMYTHALWGTQARREHLQEIKYFACKCRRCADPTELGTYLSALRCLGTEEEPCDGVQLPEDPLDNDTEWACNKCAVKLPTAEVACLVNQIGEEVDNVQLSNPTVKELKELLDKILHFLHPHHYHVYSVKHSLIQLYGYQNGYMPHQISDDLLQVKSEMCRDLIEVTKTVDPGNARLPLYLAVLFHELHLSNTHYIKRKWHVEDKSKMFNLLREGKQALSKAKQALKDDISAAAQKLRSLLLTSWKDLKKWMDRYDMDLKELEQKTGLEL